MGLLWSSLHSSHESKEGCKELRAGEGKGFPRNRNCTFLQRGLQGHSLHKSCFSQVTLNTDTHQARTPTSAGTLSCLNPWSILEMVRYSQPPCSPGWDS